MALLSDVMSHVLVPYLEEKVSARSLKVKWE